MVVATILMTDNTNRVRLFKKPFLIANVCIQVVLGMLSFILSNINVDFLNRELWWRITIIQEVTPTIGRIEFVGKKKFAAKRLVPKYGTSIVYVASLSSVVFLSSTPFNVNVL